MKIKQLPDLIETVDIIHKYISIDNVEIHLPYDILEFLEDLKNSNTSMPTIQIYDKNFIKGMIEAKLIIFVGHGKNNEIVRGGKYAFTKKFRDNYDIIETAIQEAIEE